MLPDDMVMCRGRLGGGYGLSPSRRLYESEAGS